MVKFSATRLAAAMAVPVLLSGCYGVRVSVHAPPSPPLKEVARARIVGDDLALDGLERALDASKVFFSSVNKRDALYTLGYDSYTFDQIAQSVDNFERIVEQTPPNHLHARLSRECHAYAPRTASDDDRFTAYYEPVLSASERPNERFRYPVYQQPDDLTLVRLANFFPRDRRQIHGRVRGKELVPYLSRADIDGRGLLRNRGLELAWVDDPVALYFLHIQGSGRLRLTDGRTVRVNFAASNGMPYTSVGRYMLDRGLLPPSDGSAGAMRAYLTDNPELRDQILFQNPRYIFFREVNLADKEGPIGSLGVPLVAGRSIATDPSYVPPGVVVYVKSEKPVVDAHGRLVGWDSFGRFMVNHDSGSAIHGPGRGDIYWGEGERAGLAAGYMNRRGSMAIVLCGVQPVHGMIAKTPSAGAYRMVSLPGTDDSAVALASGNP